MSKRLFCSVLIAAVSLLAASDPLSIRGAKDPDGLKVSAEAAAFEGHFAGGIECRSEGRARSCRRGKPGGAGWAMVRDHPATWKRSKSPRGHRARTWGTASLTEDADAGSGRLFRQPRFDLRR